MDKKEFVILTDSCSDLSKENRQKYDIDYLPMRYNYEDKEYPASLDWEYLSFKEYYDLMREGVRIKTSQVNANEYKEAFEKYIAEGKDVLSISCSSVLSSSYRGSLVARDEVLAAHPDSKIICIDSRNSCMSLGLICMTASMMRKDGKSIDEVAEYVEANKQKYNQFATVENLNYLKRAGRVSTMSAVFGGLLQVKPIIISDINGQNVAVEKVKGRQVSLERIADLFAENYDKKSKLPVYVVHADCEDVAQKLKEIITAKTGVKNILIEKIGPIIGASVGPGTVSAYFFGKEVTFDSNKQ